ncbi:hypothetical protein [Ekhidna sp. To15]|uniref:hypothetical protein n=1 Tax=Ekhidna sp. To15 TaxID=3395267 RepID=UPI003F524709
MGIFHFDKMRLILGALICLAFFACEGEPEQPFDLPGNPKYLLAGDSAKTWKIARRFNNGTRMNMGDCFIAHRQTFRLNNEFATNSVGRSDCGEPMTGRWSLARDPNGFNYLKLESSQIPEMMNIEEDYKLFKIKMLSDSLLVVQFNHAQTTKKQTTLVDYFVPEDVKVDDRNFHW